MFRDAASACVVGSTPRQGETIAYEVLAGKSRIIPHTEHLVDYVEKDGGSIRLHLDRKLPDAIEQVEQDFVTSLLEEAQRAKKNDNVVVPPLASFDIACHTGGPKILQKVGLGLGLDDKDHLRASWTVMKAHGNLSGASNMAVLDEQNKMVGGREWVVCLSMGPGIAIEGLVLRRVSRISGDQMEENKSVVAKTNEESLHGTKMAGSGSLRPLDCDGSSSNIFATNAA